MAENTENGQDLAKDGVEEVTQPQVETTQTGETQESQTSENTADQAKADDLETMSLDELEVKLSQPQETVHQPVSDETAKPQEAAKTEPEEKPSALAQPNKTQRGENRYQELANENKRLKAELENSRRAEQQRLAQKLNLDNPPWKADPAKANDIPLPQLNENGELSPDQYRQAVQQQAEKLADARVQAERLNWQRQTQQQEELRRLNDDMEYIKKTYPELDPESDKYSPDLDEQISNLVSVNGQLDSTNLRSRVDSVMKMRAGALARQQTQVKQLLESQAEAAAVTPSPSVPQPKEDLSKVPLEDLEDRLGVVS